MKITRLRLTGFKSFVEPTELTIEPGLTGVVGPNGCGKSNLLEALRWVMGESSPKAMRSSGMEDVIFAGTNGRPARNSAEVLVSIDNSDRRAPAQFNDGDVLEIARRIERDAGSLYRVNGRDCRQRDVQLLFADASTGAHSPALVRQGQIAELIGMKPQARRAILEEAAGISGLHSRRHEAELRLKAAETNLGRLADVIQEIEGQLANLRKQARQATRYRNLSGDIRRTEALVLFLRWQSAESAFAAAAGELEGIASELETATSEAARAVIAREDAANGLPELRQGEAEAAAALQRLRHERGALDAEAARARSAIDEARRRLQQLQGDLERERTLIRDAEETVQRLGAERSELAGGLDGMAAERERAAAHALAAASALKAHEDAFERATKTLAARDAERQRIQKARRDAEERLARLAAEFERIRAERGRIAPTAEEEAALSAARARLDVAMADLEQLEAAAPQAERERAEAEAGERIAREALQEAERKAGAIKAEAEALARILHVDKQDLWPALIDAIKVVPGYEVALGAAIGDELSAPADEAAPAHWRTLAPYEASQPLPAGSIPLSTYVNAPPALARRLAQIGLIESREAGARLQGALLPGQRLVTRDGDLWRWDGYSASAEAPTPAAQRLAQLNRLEDRTRELKIADEAAQEKRLAYHAARQIAEGAAAKESAARKAVREAQSAVNSARSDVANLERALLQSASRLSALGESERRNREDEAETRARLGDVTLEGEALGDDEAMRGEVARLRETLGEARLASGQAVAAQQVLDRQAALAAERLARLDKDISTWSPRGAAARRQEALILERIEAAEAERAEAEAAPETIEVRRVALMDLLGAAESARSAAADRLAEAESALRTAETNLKTSESRVSALREARARLEAQSEAALTRRVEVEAQIRDGLGLEPLAAAAEAGIDPDGALPDLAQSEARLERYRRERELLGGVNLRADEEANEAEARLNGLQAEKADLDGAIQKLRSAISGLNKEGRERILAAFETVNGHFERLFTKLFEGGTARLELVESEDPLEAGLEILARPPGKRLQSMSLLSGGEQALTAMSLIFAVFLSNPAPICVLDEVDAPLDDSNVDRFCNLLNEMTRISQTRFLVITHHPVTMARMDRLYGVTMQERGVSQLVSVDLSAAAQMRAAD